MSFPALADPRRATNGLNDADTTLEANPGEAWGRQPGSRRSGTHAQGRAMTERHWQRTSAVRWQSASGYLKERAPAAPADNQTWSPSGLLPRRYLARHYFYSIPAPGMRVRTAMKRPKCLRLEVVQALSAMADSRGERHVIEKPSIMQVFAPQASLHPQQSRLQFVRPVAAGIVGIAALWRDGSRPARAWFPPVVGLRHVEIIRFARREHDIVTLLGKGDPARRFVPGHEIGISGVDAAAERCFHPGAGAAAQAAEHLLDAPQEIRLQLGNLVPAVFLHEPSG